MDHIFALLFYILQPDGTLEMLAFPNNQPATMQKCQDAIPMLQDNVVALYPKGTKIFGWCVDHDYPFPPDKQPKGSI